MRDTGYRILAEGVTVSNDTWTTGLANHDLIIGPTGGGKTRSYVLPNLLNSKESFLVVDAKGNLKRQVGGILERQGFRVLELDFTNLMHSPWGYNPLRFIRWDSERKCWNEQDIITVAAALVPVTSQTDPFWDLSARNYAEALIGYTLDNLPREEHTLVSVAKLFAEAETGVLDELMREYCTICPDSFAAMRWKFFQGGRKADKTYSSILAILSQKLSNYSFGGVQQLFTNQNQIDFAAISQEPTAVFVHVSDCDFSLSNLTSLFYTQALQSVTQLDGLYGHDKAMTIIDNCDHLLYLGGQSVETARFIGVKANRPASAILNLPLGKAWLFERGALPREVKKYDLTRHPLYRQLPEYAAQRTVPERETVEEPQLMAAAGM